MGTMIEQLRKLVNGDIAAPPVAELVGYRLTAIEEGQATIELEAAKSHASPIGSMHGGILCVIGDSAMGMAYASTIELDESFVTLELKINYLKPVWEGQLQAFGRVVQRGRTIGLVEFDVINEKKVLIARGCGTFMTLRGEMASGRPVSK